MKKEEVIRYNRFNEDYIVIPISEIKLMINICKYNMEEPNISDDTKKEFQRRISIFKYVLKIIENHNKKITSINIKKESALYKELFITPKKIITIKEIEEAYKIALLENKVCIATKILKLKEKYKQIEAKTKVIVQIYHSDIDLESGKEIADYIWKNNSLEEYLKNTKQEDRHIFLYENGRIEERYLSITELNISKTKIKTIN